MIENEKKIAIRVGKETWKKWDNKRHAEGEHWQDLGVRFFTKWFKGDEPLVLSDYPGTDMIPEHLTSGEKQWLRNYMQTGLKLLKMARSGPSDALRPEPASDAAEDIEVGLEEARAKETEIRRATEGLERSLDEDKRAGGKNRKRNP